MKQAIEIFVDKYCDAFRVWASVSSRDHEELIVLQQALQYIEQNFVGLQQTEALCHAIRDWSHTAIESSEDPKRTEGVIRSLGLAITKSNLLYRLIYGGESLRLVPCPIHKGQWSGCVIKPCPEGCNFGCDITGWISNSLVSAKPNASFVGEGI